MKNLEQAMLFLLQKNLMKRNCCFLNRWAPKAALMAAYVYYADDYYFDAEFELNRFIKTYPKNPDINYAHFLLAMCYYEKIVDEKKDLGPLLQAQEKFNFIIKNYPDQIMP